MVDRIAVVAVGLAARWPGAGVEEGRVDTCRDIEDCEAIVEVVLATARFVLGASCGKLRDCAVVAIVVETEAVPTLLPCWDRKK